jgi:Flp pilus assembly protein TadB
VTDEQPTNAELAWRLEQIRLSVTELIGRREYDVAQRELDRRFAEVERQLAEQRRDTDEEIRQVHQRITDEAKRAADHRASWRTIIYTGLIPAAVVFLSIIAQIWLAKGGH